MKKYAHSAPLEETQQSKSRVLCTMTIVVVPVMVPSMDLFGPVPSLIRGPLGPHVAEPGPTKFVCERRQALLRSLLSISGYSRASRFQINLSCEHESTPLAPHPSVILVTHPCDPNKHLTAFTNPALPTVKHSFHSLFIIDRTPLHIFNTPFFKPHSNCRQFHACSGQEIPAHKMS